MLERLGLVSLASALVFGFAPYFYALGDILPDRGLSGSESVHQLKAGWRETNRAALGQDDRLRACGLGQLILPPLCA